MGIRDEEIFRLKKYAEGMGLRVIFDNRSKNKEDAAEWTTDGSEIKIYLKNNSTKTEVILSMIHEIAHHIHFIHEKNRQIDEKFEEALDHQELMNEVDGVVPKKVRKKIYDLESESIQYWDDIYKEIDIKIPKWKLEMAKERDVWVYEVYYETGKYPNIKEISNKEKLLTSRYRPKSGK